MAKNTSTYHPVQALTIQAAADLPAFRFVNFAGELCAAETKSAGVTELEWLQGDDASIVNLGVMPVETSAAITKGQDVSSDADGKAKPAPADTPVNGRALKDADAGDYVKVILVP